MIKYTKGTINYNWLHSMTITTHMKSMKNVRFTKKKKQQKRKRNQQ